jgi:hypothetical protein
MDPKKISAVKDMDPTNINTVTKIRSTRRLDTFTSLGRQAGDAGGRHGKSSNEGLTAATDVADLFLRLKTRFWLRATEDSFAAAVARGASNTATPLEAHV